MSNMEFVDEPVDVTATVNSQGQLMPQRLVWRDRQYRVVTVGRQWDEANSRAVLIETVDGSRFELHLNREGLTWRIKKIWWGPSIA